MKETTTTKQGKRIFGRVSDADHKAAKKDAIDRGIDLEDWVAEAVTEKLARRNGNLRPFPGGKR